MSNKTVYPDYSSKYYYINYIIIVKHQKEGRKVCAIYVGDPCVET